MTSPSITRRGLLRGVGTASVLASCNRPKDKPGTDTPTGPAVTDANAPAEIGHKIIVAIKLGVFAYREGKTKCFDPVAQRIVEKSTPRKEYKGDGKNHTVEELGYKATDGV